MPSENYSADDPLAGPKAKIEWAKSNVPNLDRKLSEFFATRPYEVFFEVNAERAQKIMKVRRTRWLPHSLHNLAGNIIHDLRSSLDLLACCLATKNGKTPSGVYFPFGRTKDIFESRRVQKKIDKLPPEAADMIRALQPYGGGNDLLYSLHTLDITDKHIDLVQLVQTGGLGLELENAEISGGNFSVGSLKWEPLKDSAVLMTFDAATKVDAKLSVTVGMDVSFGEVTALEGKPIVAALNELADMTQGIVTLFEDRFFK